MSTRKAILALVCFFEMFFFTIIIFGFNSITSTYKSLGVFSQFCNLSNRKSNNQTYIVCHEQDVIYGIVFVLWVSFQAISAIPGGLLVDKFGIKLTKLTAAIINTISYILFGIIQFNSWLLIPAGCLSAFSGFTLGLANFAIADDYGENKNLMLSIQSGLMGSSLLIFNIIKILFDKGIALYISFSILGFLSLLITIGGIALIPKPNRIPIKVHLVSNENVLETKSNSEKDNLDIFHLRQQYLLETFPNLQKAYFSRFYFLYTICFSFVMYRINFFLSQLASQLNYLFPGNNDIIHHLQFYCNIFLSCNLFVSVFAGLIIDHKLKTTNNLIGKDFTNEFPYRNFDLFNKIYIIPFLICILSILFASCLMGIANKYVYYFIFVLFCVGRSFNTCLIGSYILATFPKRYFGTLVATTMMVSGVLNLTQIPFNKLAAADRHPMAVNYALIACLLIAMLHPLHLYLK